MTLRQKVLLCWTNAGPEVQGLTLPCPFSHSVPFVETRDLQLPKYVSVKRSRLWSMLLIWIEAPCFFRFRVRKRLTTLLCSNWNRRSEPIECPPSKSVPLLCQKCDNWIALKCTKWSNLSRLASRELSNLQIPPLKIVPGRKTTQTYNRELSHLHESPPLRQKVSPW